MFWPKPINVRMDPFEVYQLLSQLEKTGTERYVIDNFPEYERKLDKNQQAILQRVANDIIRSQSTQHPITAVAVVGHADHAMRLPAHLRAAKEEEVSRERAKVAVAMLKELIAADPIGRARLPMIHIEPYWMGAKQAKYSNMLKNRRVVFKWAHSFSEPPIIRPPVPQPVPPGVDPEYNPNIVYAGTKFKICILDSISGGIVVGGASMGIAIWDTVNSRASAYNYDAGGVALGTSGGEGGTSDWKDFEVDEPIQCDQFTGTASHGSLAVGMSGLAFTLRETDMPKRKLMKTVNFVGFSKAVEIAGGWGRLTLIPGTTKVFKGGEVVFNAPPR